MLDTTEDVATKPAPAADVENYEPENLRQIVRDHAAVNSTSYRAIAAAAEVGESTLTAWLKGKYKGNNENIERSVRIWLKSQQTFATAKAELPDELGFVHTRTAKNFLTTLEFAQAMPDVVVITGGAGVGKTSACLQYKATHPNVWHLTAEPSVSSSYHMMEYLRETVGLPEMASYRVSRAIMLKVRQSQGLIIVDEAQHLTTQALDQLRSVHDRSHVGLALVGNEDVWRRLDGGGRKAEFAQLFSRVGMRVTASRPTKKDVEEMMDAAGIVDDKQRATLKTIAGRPGALRYMTKVLRVARRLASGDKTELTEAHIMAAWNRLEDRTTGAA